MADNTPIITLPNKSLRARSKKVGIITDDTRAIIARMEHATLEWEDSRQYELGVALAAVQIDVLLKIIIIRNNFEDKKDRTFQHLINPEITKLEGELVEDYEGCLSIKNIYGKVPRHERVKVKASNIEGEQIRITAEGFLARVLQHEIDHTKGRVFIDYIKDSPDAFYSINNEGKLEPLNYETDIQHSSILW